MKIAVYAICKNEVKFVEAFLKTSQYADYICILDTGSTDRTLSTIREVGIQLGISDKIHLSSEVVKPWRFDVARNMSLAMVPEDADLCICLDFDEVIMPQDGWRSVLEKAWQEAPQNATRLRYKYIWNWNADGSPGISYVADKIHVLKGFKWRLPVHETLSYDGQELDHWFVNDEFKFHHYADLSKPRSQYLPLLELSVKENPLDDRASHYLGREYMFYGMIDEAIAELRRHLTLNSARWNQERAASLRFLARCFWQQNRYAEANDALLRSVYEAPDSRECWVELAQAYRAFGNYPRVIECCEKALEIKERPGHYIHEPTAWGSWPQKMLDEAKSKVNTQ